MSRKEIEGQKDKVADVARVLSVTGHRDLRSEDIPALEAAVRRVLQQFQDGAETPLVLLSMLAAGADCLAARVALECGLHLIAPLPLPLELYERDFDPAHSRREFHALLAQAEHIVTIPLLPPATPQAVAEYGPARDRQYALGGAFLAQNSQAMLALWDGSVNGQPGGTAEVVGFMRNGVPAFYQDALRAVPPLFAPSSSLPPGGPVYQIVTPRRSVALVPAQAFSLLRHDPAPLVTLL